MSCQAGPSGHVYTETPFGRAQHVSIETFLDAYAPLLPSDVNIDELLNKRDIVGKNGRMWGYEHKRPSDITRQYAYSSLSRCVSKLAESSASHGPRHLFSNNLSMQWDTGKPAKETYPDAYILLGPEEEAKEPPRKKTAPTRSSARLAKRTAAPPSQPIHKSRAATTSKRRRLPHTTGKSAAWTSIAVSGVYSRSSTSQASEIVSSSSVYFFSNCQFR